jgi:hypothetical protein
MGSSGWVSLAGINTLAQASPRGRSGFLQFLKTLDKTPAQQFRAGLMKFE